MEPTQTRYLLAFLQEGIAEFERVYELAVKKKGVYESIGNCSDEVETDCITESVVMNSGLIAQFMNNKETFERLFPSVVKESTFVRTSRATKTQSLTVDRKVSSVVVKGCLRALNPAVAVKNFHVKRVITRTGEGDDDWMILDVEMGSTGAAPDSYCFSGLVVKRVSDAESTVTWIVQRPRIVVKEAYDRLASTVYGPTRWVYALKREAERRSVLGFELQLNGNLELLHNGDSMKRKLFEILSVGPRETSVHSRAIGRTFATILSDKVEAPYTNVFQACTRFIFDALGAGCYTECRLPSPLRMRNYVSSFRTDQGTPTMFETYTDAVESVIIAAPHGEPLRGFTVYPVPPFCFVTSFLLVDHAEPKTFSKWKAEAEPKTFSKWKAESETIVGQMIAHVVSKVDKVNPNPNVNVDVDMLMVMLSEV